MPLRTSTSVIVEACRLGEAECAGAVMCDTGMNSGAAAVPRKPKTPLAELKIDAQTMNMKTVIKCANAKDRAKSNAAQLAKVTPPTCMSCSLCRLLSCQSIPQSFSGAVI